MDKKLNEARQLLLGNTFIQKGSNFKNKVTNVSLNSVNQNEILVTYQTLNNISLNTPVMEYNQFLGNHYI